MTKDIFADHADVAAPAPGEQINLDDFEGSGVIPLVDKGEGLESNPPPAVPTTAFKNEEDEFEGMQDERNGFGLDEDLYPTSDFTPPPVAPAAEEEDEEDKEDQISLEQINQTLGSNFKTLDEAKAFGKKEEPEAPVVSPEETQNYENNVTAIAYLEKVNNLSDEDIIREDLTSKAISQNEGKAISEEQKEEIEFRIERYKDGGTDAIVAQSVRDRINSSISQRKTFNQKVDQKKIEAEQAKSQKNQESLKDSFRSIFNQGKYLGISLTEEDIKKTYQSVTSGEFHKRLNKDHQFTAKLALTAHLQDRLDKATSKGGYADGVEAVMAEVDGNSPSQANRSRARQVPTRSHSGNASLTGDPLVDGFLK